MQAFAGGPMADATCFGCHGNNLFSIGFGAEVYAEVDRGFDSSPSMMLAFSTDFMYIHRFSKNFGTILGPGFGFGPAPIYVDDHWESDLGAVFMLYTGVVF